MRLCELTLRDFRNYEQLHLAAEPGVNLIVGDNAQGKTNLLESIVYLGSGKSWRTQKSAELVRFGAAFADLEAKVFSEEREQTLRTVIFPGRRPRQLWRNGVKKKSASECAGVLNTVLFCPEDLMVLKSGASARRRLGDMALCQLRPNYDAALAEYNLRICQVGALLISYRARFYESLGKEASVYHGQFSGGAEDFRLDYHTVSTVADPFAPVAKLTEDLQNHMESHARAELETAQCLTGPHKDDFDVHLNGLSVKTYGSQGQTRTAAISLKLAQRELMKRESGQEPVLLLDDVLSELDPGRQDFVLNQIQTGQVFITCCEADRFTKIGQTIQIRKGQIV